MQRTGAPVHASIIYYCSVMPDWRRTPAQGQWPVSARGGNGVTEGNNIIVYTMLVPVPRCPLSYVSIHSRAAPSHAHCVVVLSASAKLFAVLSINVFFVVCFPRLFVDLCLPLSLSLSASLSLCTYTYSHVEGEGCTFIMLH